MNRMRAWLQVLWRGLAMGSADVIPGVSGGTIAFITGIYPKFIATIRACTRAPKNFVQRKPLGIDWGFLLPLAVGILLAFGLGALILPGLLAAYPALVYALFIGLIGASAYLVYASVLHRTPRALLWGILGFLFGLFINMLSTTTMQAPSYAFIALVGFIAISAMLLPGISGSHIVLLFGQYAFLLHALTHIHTQYWYVLAFGMGALLGLAVLSDVITYLLKTYNAETLIALAGIMLGSLYTPLREVATHTKGISWVLATLFALIGVLLVLGLSRLHR